MKSRKFTSIFFLLIFVLPVTEFRAQNVKFPQQIKILNNYGSIPFEDGKTVVVEVKFVGLDSDYEHYDEKVGVMLPESDCRKFLRENLAEINTDDKFSGGRVSKAVKLLRRWISEKDYIDTEIMAFGEKLPKNRMNIVFKINKGALAYVSQIRFTENFNISNEDYIADFKKCSGDNWEIFDTQIYEYYSQQCSRKLMFSKGYVKGNVLKIVPKLIGESRVVTITVDEGVRYRVGKIKIEGAKVLTDKEILEMSELNEGDVADAKHLQDFLYNKLPRVYADKGYIQFNDEFDVEVIKPLAEGLDGTVDILISIDEGLQYKISEIVFTGLEAEKDAETLQNLMEMLSVKEGEVYSRSKFEKSINKISETRQFYPIDFDKDIEILIPIEKDNKVSKLTVEELSKIRIIIKLRRLQ